MSDIKKRERKRVTLKERKRKSDLKEKERERVTLKREKEKK